MIAKLRPVAKAVVAAVVGAVAPFVSILIMTGTVDERAVGAAAATASLSAFLVWWTPNKPAVVVPPPPPNV